MEYQETLVFFAGRPGKFNPLPVLLPALLDSRAAAAFNLGSESSCDTRRRGYVLDGKELWVSQSVAYCTTSMPDPYFFMTLGSSSHQGWSRASCAVMRFSGLYSNSADRSSNPCWDAERPARLVHHLCSSLGKLSGQALEEMSRD